MSENSGLLAQAFPPAWAVCTIGEAGDAQLGQAKTKAQSPGEILPYLRVANVQDAQLDLADLERMPFANPERYRLQPGDVLLCEGQSPELVGRAAMYSGAPGALLYQNSLIRFRPYASVNPEYALSVFRSYQKTGIFRSIAKSTTNIAHLSVSRLRTLPFPLPPVSVQREIVEILGPLQDNLDLIADVTVNCLQALDQVVQTIRTQEILGADAHTWRDGNRGQSHWIVKRAKEVVAADAPIVYGIVQPGPNVENGIRYVRGLDIQDGYINEQALWRTAYDIAERYRRSSLETGDVLLNLIRHTRVAAVPQTLAGANITRTTALFRPGTEVTSGYLAHWLASDAAQDWLAARMRGIDMPGLNLKDVRELPMPVPPLAVQGEMQRLLDEMLRQCDNLRASCAALQQALPDLEGALLESFAYGASAMAISDKIPFDVQLALSQEVLEQVAAAGSESEAMAAVARAATGTAARRGRDDVREDGKRMQPSSGGPKATTATDVADALAALGGSASPEELYAAMRLAQSAVDSFYEALRELLRSNKLVEDRPDDTEVSLRVVSLK